MHVFSPHKAHLLQPDAVMLDESLCSIPFFSSEVVNQLKEELPAYLARAADSSTEISILDWWKRNANDLPYWADATKKILLLQPSSAAAERVFSLLRLLLSFFLLSGSLALS